MDTWIEATAGNRNNLLPENVPWKAIRTLLSDCIYGGKIDNEFDQRLLSSFLEKLFVPESFERDFSLVSQATRVGRALFIKMPKGEGGELNYFEIIVFLTSEIIILTSHNCISHLRELYFWLKIIIFLT